MPSTMPAVSVLSPTSKAVGASHAIVAQGLQILENLDHRALWGPTG